jgi:outer membrane protein assembly factor BamE (lipoprotein component of BamABCDE complex)
MKTAFKLIIILVLPLMIVMITGCASSGNSFLKKESLETIESRIVQGQTTKQEIRNTYGDPLLTSFTDSGNEIWTYQFDKMSLDALSLINPLKNTYNGTRKQLVIMFDSNGVVSRYNMNASPHKTEMGIL